MAEGNCEMELNIFLAERNDNSHFDSGIMELTSNHSKNLIVNIKQLIRAQLEKLYFL